MPVVLCNADRVGEDLCEQRIAAHDHRGEQHAPEHRRPVRGGGAREQHGEREHGAVGEQAPGVLPAGVGLHRPDHRQRRECGEREQQAYRPRSIYPLAETGMRAGGECLPASAGGREQDRRSDPDAAGQCQCDLDRGRVLRLRPPPARKVIRQRTPATSSVGRADRERGRHVQSRIALPTQARGWDVGGSGYALPRARARVLQRLPGLRMRLSVPGPLRSR